MKCLIVSSQLIVMLVYVIFESTAYRDYQEERGRLHYGQSLKLLSAGQIQESNEAFRKAQQIHPDKQLATFYRSLQATLFSKWGHNHFRKREFDKAIANFNEAIRLDPNISWLYISRGRVYSALLQYELALADFDRAIEQAPDIAVGYSNRGDVYRRQKQFDLALEDYSRALALGPNDSNVKHHVALVLLNCPHAQLRDTARALELAEEAVKVDPEEASGWSVLGQARYRSDDYQGALEPLQKSIELGYSRKARAWFFLAMTHWQLGNQDEARQLYDQAAEWTRENEPPGASIPARQFREEAAELMGIDSYDEYAAGDTADRDNEN